MSVKQAGIDAIVNLCAACYDLHETEKDFDFDFKTARKMLRQTPAWPASRVQIDGVDRIIEQHLGQRISTKRSDDRSSGQGRFFDRLRNALRWYD